MVERGELVRGGQDLRGSQEIKAAENQVVTEGEAAGSPFLLYVCCMTERRLAALKVRLTFA
jgi:hypothetical protein